MLTDLSILFEQRRQTARERRAGRVAVRLATGVAESWKRIRNALGATVVLTALKAGRLRSRRPRATTLSVGEELTPSTRGVGVGVSAAGDTASETLGLTSRAGGLVGDAASLTTGEATTRDRRVLREALLLAALLRR